MPRMKQETRTTRVDVRVTEEAKALIDSYARESNMYESWFYSTSLVLGARMLARALTPEKYLTEEQLRVGTQAAVESLVPPEVQRAVLSKIEP